MAVGTQYKTSMLIQNEALLGFEDNYELLNRVNTDYQEMIAQANGMPSGGAISVRSQLYRTPQTGQNFTVSEISQEFETINVETDQMLGDLFSVGSTEFEVSRNRITDLTHYQTATAIASQVNLQCYRTLQLGAPYYVGSSASSDVNYSLVSSLRRFATELSIPEYDTSLFMNAKDYQSLVNQGVRGSNIFSMDDVNAQSNRYAVGSWAGIPLFQSQTLGTIRHIAGSASGDTLQFDGVVSTDSYKSAVINILSSAIYNNFHYFNK